MALWEETSLEIYLTVEGEEKEKKQNFRNIIENPTEADITAFGNLIDQITPVEQTYSSTVLVTRNRIYAN